MPGLGRVDLSGISTWLLIWWELWVVVGIGVVGTIAAPVLIRKSTQTRALRDPVRKQVRDAGIDPTRVSILAGGGAGIAFATGVSPRRGRVFIGERLVRTLPPTAVAAVISHEHAHLARGHVLLRIAVPVGFAVTWASASTITAVPGVVVGLLLIPPALASTLVIARRTEIAADAFAAERVDGAALARALSQLAREGHVRAGGRLSRHPRLSSRLAKLKASNLTDGVRRSDDAVN